VIQAGQGRALILTEANDFTQLRHMKKM
jgi:hypothetical protein